MDPTATDIIDVRSPTRPTKCWRRGRSGQGQQARALARGRWGGTIGAKDLGRTPPYIYGSVVVGADRGATALGSGKEEE